MGERGAGERGKRKSKNGCYVVAWLRCYVVTLVMLSLWKRFRGKGLLLQLRANTA